MKCKTFLTNFFLLAILFSLSAQKMDVEQLKGLKIRNIGPAGMSGRVTSIDVNLSNPDIIFVGTASGGVWKSESGGIDWEPVFDKEPVESIGSIAINQRNPSEIWVGTGEGNPRNSLSSGAGIFKSLDGGKTWKLMGLKETKTIHRIIIDRDDPNTVFVAALGSAWGPNEERGVFKTTDGGKTWNKILYSNDGTGCADLVADPSNPNKLIAAMWEFGRKPWTFNSGGPNSGIYVTLDGGETWKKRSDKDGLPKGDLGRIGLAIAPSKPNIVYALVEAKENALYKSTDGGTKWKKMATDDNIGNRPFYYADIFVDPNNENRIFSLWSVLSRSEDGGKSFQRWVGWKIHPDHHAFWVHPNDPDFMMEGNDGGLNISRDGGESWRFVENLPLAQFYHINYDMAVPYNVGGGMQDNGSWVGPSQVWKAGGIRNYDWQEVNFGDGFDVAIRPDDGRYVYAMSQGGNLVYMDRETGKREFIKPIHPEGVELRFNWNAALAQNPFHGCGIYYGSQFLHKSLDCGQSWEIISPDLTTNDSTKQKQDKSGGLTIDNTAAENFTTIIAIGPSPVDEKVIWVGTDDGNLQLTQDGGSSWTNLADRLPEARSGSWIPYIEVSQKNAGEAFVVVNDYRRNDWRPMVYHTTDFGATFSRIADEKKVSGFALSIVQDPRVPNLLWLGTDFGLYVSIDGGDHWNKWTNDYPSVATSDLKIHPREQDLIVGTFGRAAWILDDIRPFQEIARTRGGVLEQPFKVFDAPDAYLATYRSVDGVRFVADATFVGTNRRTGAMLTIWLNKKAMKKDKKEEANEDEKEDKSSNEGKKGKDKKSDKVKVRVIDEAGDTIRTFTAKVDSFMTRIYWNLSRDGVRFPSRKKPKPDADLPSGYSVLPGTYKLVVTLGKYADSTRVNVLADPRLKVSLKTLQTKNATYDEFYSLIEKATTGFNGLLDAEKTIKLVNEALVNAPDSTKKEISKLGKSLKDSIAQLEKRYMQPEGLKGIQRNPNTLNTTLFRTFSYIGSSEGAPNQAARLMLEKTRKEVTAVASDINAFFEKDFADYQKKVEAIKYSLFKEFETIGVD